MNELDVDDLLHQSNKGKDAISNLQPDWLSQLDEETASALWIRAGKAWESLLNELSGDESDADDTVVVVGHPVTHVSLIAQCLGKVKEGMGLFHLDAGSISVIDFPDGPGGRGVVRCTNYTAHLGRWSIPITTTAAAAAVAETSLA